MKGTLRQIYGELVADETAFIEGGEDELVGRLQRKLGKSEEEVRALLEKKEKYP